MITIASYELYQQYNLIHVKKENFFVWAIFESYVWTDYDQFSESTNLDNNNNLNEFKILLWRIEVQEFES